MKKKVQLRVLKKKPLTIIVHGVEQTFLIRRGSEGNVLDQTRLKIHSIQKTRKMKSFLFLFLENHRIFLFVIVVVVMTSRAYRESNLWTDDKVFLQHDE